MYLDTLANLRAVRQSSAYPILDFAEERLLDQLAVFWLAGKKITVLKAMDMAPDTSSTTVHRRLKTLRQKKMLQLELDEDDNRVKYILPTELARAYLGDLGRSVERSVTQGEPPAGLPDTAKLTRRAA